MSFFVYLRIQNNFYNFFSNFFTDTYSNILSEEKSKEYLGEMIQVFDNMKELELNLSK